MNVHSQTRPHFCPVKGCPRSEGGKGFKRKNEMIRHGLVHQSPGYVCPFCPDREHKYPRPDNLQRSVHIAANTGTCADSFPARHVRVHHVDKDKDDAQLRDVLAQRPEGGSRGRRRRVCCPVPFSLFDRANMAIRSPPANDPSRLLQAVFAALGFPQDCPRWVSFPMSSCTL